MKTAEFKIFEMDWLNEFRGSFVIQVVHRDVLFSGNTMRSFSTPESVDAGEGKVVRLVRSTVLFWNNMLHVSGGAQTRPPGGAAKPATLRSV